MRALLLPAVFYCNNFIMFKAEHGDEAYDACLNALKMGYRHIDTAQLYRNEGSVGRAIKDSGVPPFRTCICGTNIQ